MRHTYCISPCHEPEQFGTALVPELLEDLARLRAVLDRGARDAGSLRDPLKVALHEGVELPEARLGRGALFPRQVSRPHWVRTVREEAHRGDFEFEDQPLQPLLIERGTIIPHQELIPIVDERVLDAPLRKDKARSAWPLPPQEGHDRLPREPLWDSAPDRLEERRHEVDEAHLGADPAGRGRPGRLDEQRHVQKLQGYAVAVPEIEPPFAHPLALVGREEEPRGRSEEHT